MPYTKLESRLPKKKSSSSTSSPNLLADLPALTTTPISTYPPPLASDTKPTFASLVASAAKAPQKAFGNRRPKAVVTATESHGPSEPTSPSTVTNTEASVADIVEIAKCDQRTIVAADEAECTSDASQEVDAGPQTEPLDGQDDGPLPSDEKPAPDSPKLDVNEVVQLFVVNYYNWFCVEPSRLHLFYGPDSTSSHASFITGESIPAEDLTSIEARFALLGPQQMKDGVVRIVHLQHQVSVGGSLLVFVNGTLTNATAGLVEVPFVHVLLLAASGYASYVKNDIFSFVSNGTATTTSAAQLETVADVSLTEALNGEESGFVETQEMRQVVEEAEDEETEEQIHLPIGDLDLHAHTHHQKTTTQTTQTSVSPTLLTVKERVTVTDVTVIEREAITTLCDAPETGADEGTLVDQAEDVPVQTIQEAETEVEGKFEPDTGSEVPALKTFSWAKLISELTDAPTGSPTAAQRAKKDTTAALDTLPSLSLPAAEALPDVKKQPPLTIYSPYTFGSGAASPAVSVYIANLSAPVTAHDLLPLLAPFGPVTYIDVVRDKRCAFVNFAHAEDAQAAKGQALVLPDGTPLWMEERRFRPSSKPYIPGGRPRYSVPHGGQPVQVHRIRQPSTLAPSTR